MDLLKALQTLETQYTALYERIDAYTPTGLGKNLDSAVEKQIVFRSDLLSLRMTIVILTCSVLEAYINYYLALKTTAGQFKILEKAKLIEKWTITPSLFIQDYKFDKSTALYSDLKRLIETRNRIVHTKPYIVNDGELIHEGYFPEWHKSEHQFIKRYFSLPLDLLKQLAGQENSEITSTLAITSGYPLEQIIPSKA